MPKGGMSEVSTEPEETEDEASAEEETTEEEAADEEAVGGEAVEGKPVPRVAVGAAEVIVMKVLGKSPPPLLENPLPLPLWCL
jgi:hypothetical protein